MPTTPPRKRIVYVTGLARSGSTLLCQLLAQHPDVHSTARSSPLCHALSALRRRLSDDPFLLSQLDDDFDRVYARLVRGFRGFLHGWVEESDRPVVVEKNRGWLGMIETLRELDPDFRMLVCVRELVQLYGSIETQHQKTILLDFPDHLADRSRYSRADALFSANGVIGGPLRSLQAVQDLDDQVRARLFFVVFEDLTRDPARVLQSLWSWLQLPAIAIDLERLELQPPEADSHYRFKYPHRVRARVEAPSAHRVPARIASDIRKQFRWYYETFYPGLLTS